MAHTAPAATIGEPSEGRPTNHSIWIEEALTPSAKRPSAHGTNTVAGSIQAVPPHAPAHTRRLASSPPTPPRLPARNTYATPCLPIAITKPPGSRVAPTDPRSVSLAFSAAQLDGAKYEVTVERS